MSNHPLIFHRFSGYAKLSTNVLGNGRLKDINVVTETNTKKINKIKTFVEIIHFSHAAIRQ